MASGYGKTETKTMAGQTHWLNNILFGIEGKKIKNKIDQTGLVGSDVVLCMVNYYQPPQILRDLLEPFNVQFEIENFFFVDDDDDVCNKQNYHQQQRKKKLMQTVEHLFWWTNDG